MAPKKRGRTARTKTRERLKERTFRIRGDLDEKLQAAATQSGRSIKEEIEYRLDRTFRDEKIRQQALQQKEKAIETVEAALANAVAALRIDTAHHEDEEPKRAPRPIGDALKDIAKQAPKKGDKL